MRSRSPASRSFATHLGRNLWHCFRCGAGGNALDLWATRTRQPLHAAVLDLWQHEDGDAQGDRTGARRELLRTSEVVSGWYDDLAASLLSRDDPRAPLDRDEAADGRLVDAVRADLRSDDGEATATAVRMIWTGDHLDGARRAQQLVIEPARHAAHA